MNQEVIAYIIQFLVNSPEFNCNEMISYGRKQKKGGLLIWQSEFFDDGIYGNTKSLPNLPLQVIEDVPFLFGEPKVEENEKGMILYADLVASAYFLLSRYEEWIQHDIRDEHGRFPGKKSLPYRAGVIDRPVVDEYGRILRKYLRRLGFAVSEPEEEFASITLTHDIDQPWTNYSFVGAIRRMLGSLWHQKKFVLYPMMNFFHHYSSDPYNIFDEIIQLDQAIKYKNVKIIFFTISSVLKTIKSSFDYLPTKEFRKILEGIAESGCELGLHVSYEAGEDPSLIMREKEKQERVTCKAVKSSRHHYLRACEPQDMWELLKAGIMDDYTMSYADVAGFRLGTARKVFWIDPINKKLTSLTLHPLQIMECSLNTPKYMGLERKDAVAYCKKIIENTKSANGDLCLLWHNTTLAENNPSYTRELYRELLNWIGSEEFKGVRK